MSSTDPDSDIDANISEFKAWFAQEGGFLHPDCYFAKDEFGLSLKTKAAIPPDTTVVSCPFSLAITHEATLEALNELFAPHSVAGWTAKQLLCTYIAMHWLIDPKEHEGLRLRHTPYLKMFPAVDQLRTPMYFTRDEFCLLEGSNLHSAVVDKQKEWQDEYEQCRDLIKDKLQDDEDAFSFEIYTLAATYLSTRAFSSSILSATPTLLADENSYPVLIPGVDSLNHRRAEPVTWSTSRSKHDGAMSISIIVHNSVKAGGELFNNYGPKPNGELVLGYGFAIEDNPEDTLLVKISGIDIRWEIGRGATGVDALYDAVINSIIQLDDGKSDEPILPTPKDLLDLATLLNTMAEELSESLPVIPTQEKIKANGLDIRPEVREMVAFYIKGQFDIVGSMIDYFDEKEKEMLHQIEDGTGDIPLKFKDLAPEPPDDDFGGPSYSAAQAFNFPKDPASRDPINLPVD